MVHAELKKKNSKNHQTQNLSLVCQLMNTCTMAQMGVASISDENIGRGGVGFEYKACYSL